MSETAPFLFEALVRRATDCFTFRVTNNNVRFDLDELDELGGQFDGAATLWLGSVLPSGHGSFLYRPTRSGPVTLECDVTREGHLFRIAASGNEVLIAKRPPTVRLALHEHFRLMVASSFVRQPAERRPS